MALIEAAIGSVIGKVLGKATEWIPSKPEARRNSLTAYKKERDELLKKQDNAKNHARMSYLNQRISMLEKAGINA